jgi:hypothetical protein
MEWAVMAADIDYSKKLIVEDAIGGQTHAVEYIGPHPTMPGWHQIMDGGVRDVDQDGNIIADQIAQLKVRNRE